MKKDASNYYYIDVSAETDWTEELKDLSDFTKVGSLDWDEITAVEVVNNTGSTADMSLYGLQFLAPMAEEEHYVPITWEILGGANEGALYIGPEEMMELYHIDPTGHLFIDSATIKFIDLWGAGFGQMGSWEWEIGNTDISGMNDNSVETWGFWGGTWRLPYSITVDGFGVYDGASVVVSDRVVSDVGGCVVDDGVLGVKISALQVDIYSTSGGCSILSVPTEFTADTMINLKTGKITIPSDLTLSAVEYQAGTTIEIDSGYTLYARSISGSGTLTGTTKILKESIVDAPLDISHTHVADYTNEAGW